MCWNGRREKESMVMCVEGSFVCVLELDHAEPCFWSRHYSRPQIRVVDVDNCITFSLFYSFFLFLSLFLFSWEKFTWIGADAVVYFSSLFSSNLNSVRPLTNKRISICQPRILVYYLLFPILFLSFCNSKFNLVTDFIFSLLFNSNRFLSNKTNEVLRSGHCYMIN